MLKDLKTSWLPALGILVLVNIGGMVIIFLKLNRLEISQTNAASISNQANPDIPGQATSPVPVKTLDSPSKGNPNAPVTIVEFSDFECTFCKEVQPVISKLLKENNGQLRHVFRNYPISSIHPGAENAAIAGLCANEQNKFWEYHDKVFEKANDKRPLTKDILKTTASELGLERTTFDTCLDSKKYLARVQKDIRDATSYGVAGTPTFFINNRIISGNQPIEVFKEIINEEINKSK